MLLFDERQFLPQTLRPYQAEAVAAIRAAWDAGDPAPLAALATGAGKTTIIAQLLVEAIDPAQHRALVIGHTEEIIGQLHDRITNQYGGLLDAHFGDWAVPGSGIVMAEKDSPDARIVVATRQSLHPRRLPRLLKSGPFDVLIIDEAHHAFGDNTYGQIIKALRAANPNLKLCGLTATPARGDRQALASIFTSICYEWLIPQGILNGYLVPVTRVKVSTQVNLSSVKTNTGDYNQTQLLSALDAANWLDLSARAYHEHIVDTTRPCLAFLPSVEMSQQFAARLRGDGIAAAHIDATTPKDERRRLLREYTDGKVATICNVGVLTEGFDAPATGAVFLARPTRSRTLFTQIVGRGLRPYPGKHDCLLVDLTVLDTKALEVGTLLGRMTTCPECGTEYYAGLKACPACGYIKPLKRRLQDGDGAPQHVGLFEGDRLVANYEALFEKAFAAWYQGPDGFLSCTLGFDDGAFIIVPPLEDNYYRLVHVPKLTDQPIKSLQRNEDLASLMIAADQEISQRARSIAQKDATWRSEPATLAQVNLLRKLGAEVPHGLSKGAASQIITHTLAVKRLMQE